MDQSRRAVESYWRSRMIDAATSDEDKVTPVYKLEEICDLLRSSHVSIVKEVSQFILKRLEHKSPIVKQKALRIIKYAVGKSGPEFRREMQRNSVAVRQLIHYKGQPDPLKGEALNKAVRETAQEALSVLFSTDDSKVAPTESNLRGRIQGFGNTNYEMPSEDKKSFINEVVDIGSATIKQGLSSLTQSPSLRRSHDPGSYRSPNLQRSLTRESDHFDRYEGSGSHADTYNTSRFSQNAGSGSWGENVTASKVETSDGDSGLTYSQKTREEKLLETIVTSGGVRLQPTRDALNVFMVEASKLDALSLGHAIETKLGAPMWQVRMRAICVLEAVLRKKEDRHFSVIASYFGHNKDVVVQCSESPQASLREKATKVLSLLGGEQINGGVNHVEKSAKISQPSVMPDLIDTGEPSDILGMEDSEKTDTKLRNTNAAHSTALIEDLLGNNFGVGEGTEGQKLDEDPFADVSFLASQDKDHGADLFPGIAVGNSGATEAHAASQKTESEQFDLFSLNSEVFHENPGNDAANLMDGLSINGSDSLIKKNGSNEKDDKNVDSVSNNYSDNKNPTDILNSVSSQAVQINANPMFPLGGMAYNFPSGLMFNAAFGSQPMNYGAMGNLFAQQQFLATMSNLHQQGGLQSNASMYAAKGGSSSPLPDIFNPGIAIQPPASMMNGSKKEDTKAFDFISDHLASARDPKRVI